MSQAYMEHEFPLGRHEQAAKIKRFVMDSLFSENVDPSVSKWSDEAVLYIRSSWTYLSDRLADDHIELSSEDEAALIDFASEYASKVDDEENMAELIQLRKEGDN